MFFFFFNDTATTEIYTLSLHDALPILRRRRSGAPFAVAEPDDCDEEQQLDRREHGRRPPEDVGEEHVGGPREVGAGVERRLGERTATPGDGERGGGEPESNTRHGDESPQVTVTKLGH